MKDLNRGKVLNYPDLSLKDQACIAVRGTLEINCRAARTLFGHPPGVNAAVKHRIRRSGPLAFVLPTLRRGPDLGTAIVFPSGGGAVFFRRVSSAAMPRIHVEEVLGIEPELD